MKYNHLLHDIERAFSELKRPSTIYTPPALEENFKGEYLAIQQDFGNVSPKEMSEHQCSMMLCDIWMISDEALCYFLPKLANKLLQERGYEDIYRRLININPALLNSEQKEVIDKIIFTLKELELQLEIEESKELNQAWENWEESLRNSEDINDMLLLAIAKGSIEEVKNLIEQGADIKKKDSKGNSPLDIAEYKGQVEIIKYLQQLSAKS
jgi:hypothetical protein